MYFSSNNYPELGALSKKEKGRIIKVALRSEGKWVTKRFWAFLVLLFISTVLLTRLNLKAYLGDWDGLVISVLFGLIFYAYLIWEINGGIYSAVRQYLMKNENKRQ